jgi:hypothetical protein
VIVLHENDPSLELDEWDEETEAPEDADFTAYDDDDGTETENLTPEPDG